MVFQPRMTDPSIASPAIELVVTISGKTAAERARIFEILRSDDYIEALREILEQLFRRSRKRGDIVDDALASSFPELSKPSESEITLQRKILDELEERFWDILTIYNISL